MKLSEGTITVTVPLTRRNLEILAELTSVPITASAETAEPTPANEKMPDKKTVAAALASATGKKEETPDKKVETVTKTDVRALALKLSRAGKSDKIQEVFSKFGGTKLSDISESDYPEVKKSLEEAVVSLNG